MDKHDVVRAAEHIVSSRVYRPFPTSQLRVLLLLPFFIVMSMAGISFLMEMSPLVGLESAFYGTFGLVILPSAATICYLVCHRIGAVG